LVQVQKMYLTAKTHLQFLQYRAWIFVKKDNYMSTECAQAEAY